MDSLVTLIVKAPNQQIEDQTIMCEPTWTIQKLKQHLSEVYPSKPPKHEQKLIYSGQLLSDSVTLKEVLRQYEGQETHTVHLVCSSKYANQTTIPQSTPANVTTNNTPTSTTASSQSQTTTIPNNTGQNVPNVAPNNMAWVNVNNPLMTPMDPNQYAMQLAWMQQAYFQYMAQYMQLAANSYGTNPTAVPTTNHGDIPGQQQQPLPHQPEPQPAAEAPIAPPRDPDLPERDWLDIFYLLSRAVVLISVVYFYSSPLRFLFVLMLGFGLYLYQIGFFRNINNINNNNNNVPTEQAQEVEQAPSRFMVVWTFFATFFASLIPEIPNAI